MSPGLRAGVGRAGLYDRGPRRQRHPRRFYDAGARSLVPADGATSSPR